MRPRSVPRISRPPSFRPPTIPRFSLVSRTPPPESVDLSSPVDFQESPPRVSLPICFLPCRCLLRHFPPLIKLRTCGLPLCPPSQPSFLTDIARPPLVNWYSGFFLIQGTILSPLRRRSPPSSLDFLKSPRKTKEAVLSERYSHVV